MRAPTSPVMAEATTMPPDEGTLPPLSGAVAWLNSSPLSSQALRGKVVLKIFGTDLAVMKGISPLWIAACFMRLLPFIDVRGIDGNAGSHG